MKIVIFTKLLTIISIHSPFCKLTESLEEPPVNIFESLGSYGKINANFVDENVKTEACIQIFLSTRGCSNILKSIIINE